MTNMLQVEFHCHTLYSKDSLNKLEALLAECQKKGIDRLAITDHNNITGALLAAKMDPDRIIIGEEIMTAQGEILAFYVQEEIPKGLEPEEVIRRLREQDAFISVSHPFDHTRNGAWALTDLKGISPWVDAIETFNARCLGNRPNRDAQAYALANHLPGTAGSDAHILTEVGTASQLLPNFNNAAELRQVIWQAQPRERLSPFWVHFASTYAKFHKRIGKLIKP